MQISPEVQRHVDELYEQGFTYLPALYSPEECQAMRDALDGYWKQQGSPALSANGGFGFAIHPLMPRVPELAPFLDRPLLIEVTGAALKDRPRLVHLGARISGRQSNERIDWHEHYGWEDTAKIKGRTRIERLLAGVYVDGTQSDAGAFIALPRRFDEAIQEPLGGRQEPWPGEVEVEMPPGSVALFDTALWHAAQRGNAEQITRRLWGCHIQGWEDPRSHREDNDVDPPSIAQYKAKSVGLRTLLGDANIA